MILHVIKLKTFKRKYKKDKRIGLYLIELNGKSKQFVIFISC